MMVEVGGVGWVTCYPRGFPRVELVRNLLPTRIPVG